MANLPISGLTASASNLASTDLAPVVQTVGVGPVKMTGLQLAGGLLGSTTFNGSTVTTSSPVLNLTQTWNAGAVTFTGLKFNATDTASASGSLLLDLQVGGASQFNLSKSGVATFAAGSKTAPTVKFSGLNGGFYGRASGFISVSNGSVEVGLISGNGTAFLNSIGLAAGAGSGGDLSVAGADLILTRAAAATLQLGLADAAAPVAQTFKVQGVVAGTTNTAGANFTIQGSQGTGTGAGGSIIFQVAPAGSTGSSQNAYSTALTIAGDRSATFASSIVMAANANLRTGSGTGYIAPVTNPNYYIGADGGIIAGQTGYLGLASTLNDAPNGADVLLRRDAANTLALRNGGTSGTPVPQTFNVYNFYTDASNFERTQFAWSSNTFFFQTSQSGGTLRDISIGGNSIKFRTQVTSGFTEVWNFSSAGHFLASTDNTYDIGASGASRPRNIYVATSVRTDSFYTTSTAGFYYILNRFSLQSAADGTVYFTNAAGTDFNRLQFGGTTSSFPALKRISSGNCLQVIAADNTASAGFIVGNQALATSATDGFLYVPTCAGTPTGTPTTQTGTAPVVVDTTNNKLYFYSGGQWRDAGP